MNKHAFTLLEIMVVIVLLGIMVAFALPEYAKSLRRAHERDSVVQLRIIYAANSLYKTQADEYLDDGGSTLNEAQINAGLNIKIHASDMTYEYDRLSTSAYLATAEWSDGGGDFTVGITQDLLSDSNPCCYCDSCPSLPNCSAMCP